MSRGRYSSRGGIGKNWCFTLNNYTAEDETFFREKAFVEWDARYLVVGKEVGESGTPHLQGFCCFRENKRLAALKKLDGRAHWEQTRGSAQQAAAYCRKGSGTSAEPANFDGWEFGELPLGGIDGGAAVAEKWSIARRAACAGNFDEIPDNIFVTHYSNLVRISERYVKRPEDLKGTTGMWIYGQPGCGKSYVARSFCNDNFYVKSINKWWDGYGGEERVVIDDVSSNHKWLGDSLKIWLDQYAFRGEMKGGGVWMRPKLIVITSNFKPDEIWEGVELAAITRRIRIVEFNANMRGINIFPENDGDTEVIAPAIATSEVIELSQ